MADGKVYKLIEIVGTSSSSIDDAMKSAVIRASKTLKGIDWVELEEVRGLVQDGKLTEFQTKLKVGFRLMDETELEA
jgi:flavin-binding protein dodecin